MLIAKLRDRLPPPQVTEHEPHEPHEPTQLIGHASLLQLACSELPADTAHAEPPLAACVLTLYARDFEPPPHVAEHEPHVPHEPTQSTPVGFLLVISVMRSMAKSSMSSSALIS